MCVLLNTHVGPDKRASQVKVQEALTLGVTEVFFGRKKKNIQLKMSEATE